MVTANIYPFVLLLSLYAVTLGTAIYAQVPNEVRGGLLLLNAVCGLFTVGYGVRWINEERVAKKNDGKNRKVPLSGKEVSHG